MKKQIPYTCDGCGKDFLSIRRNNANRKTFCTTVCRENHYEKVDANKKRSKFYIFKRDNFKCVYCGKSSIEHGVLLHLDHIVSVSMGGDNNIDNLVTACESCNMHKGPANLSKEVIFRLWGRNKQLNIQFDYSYDDLRKEFEEWKPAMEKLKGTKFPLK